MESFAPSPSSRLTAGVRAIYSFPRLTWIVLSVVALRVLGCADGPATRDPETDRASPPVADHDLRFLEEVQQRTLRWFWETSDPETGLIRDRYPDPSFASVAATGFGLTGYGIASERGYFSREEVVDRVLRTLSFLLESPMGEGAEGFTGYRGLFYHFLSMGTGGRYGTVELSSMDTALLMAGVLFCQSYFDRDTEEEVAIRSLADSLYRRVEWDWFQRGPSFLLAMEWKPGAVGFGDAVYQGYNEAMVLYLLALGSPTHPIEPEAWEVYTSTYEWGDVYDQEHVLFGPLFGHQYSHVWIDFRGIQDAYMREKGIDYFENSRRAALSQRSYAMDNPGGFRG